MSIFNITNNVINSELIIFEIHSFIKAERACKTNCRILNTTEIPTKRIESWLATRILRKNILL